jgi:hypothetical protein
MWLQQRGDPRAFDRVRLKMLSKTLKERVSLDKVDDNTLVSQDYYTAFVNAVADVTGERVQGISSQGETVTTLTVTTMTKRS